MNSDEDIEQIDNDIVACIPWPDDWDDIDASGLMSDDAYLPV